MNRDDILRVLSAAAGDPSVGAVRDALPALADAMVAALSPEQERSTEPAEVRLVSPAETR